ncbi:MAG: hypothetical protein AAF518_24490 [Spirochaetota bacterium]
MNDLLMINIGMTLSVVCFFSGYFYRKRDRKLHVYFNCSGVFFNLSTAIYLLALKYLLGGLEKANISPIVPPWAVLTHRFFAFIALVLMLLMLFSGILKKRGLHIKMHYIFLPLYTIIYVSGLFIFTSR